MYIDFITQLKAYLDECCLNAHKDNAKGIFPGIPSSQSAHVVKGKGTPSTGFSRHIVYATRQVMLSVFNEGWKVAGGYCKAVNHCIDDIASFDEREQIVQSGEPKIFENGKWYVTPELECYKCHFWLERNGWILDLSADQLGHNAITLTMQGDGRYRRVEELSSGDSVRACRVTALKWLSNGYETKDSTELFNLLMVKAGRVGGTSLR